LVANFFLTYLFLLSGNTDEVEAGPGSRVVRLVGAELGAALAEDGETVISNGDVLLDDLLATEARPAVCVEDVLALLLRTRKRTRIVDEAWIRYR